MEAKQLKLHYLRKMIQFYLGIPRMAAVNIQESVIKGDQGRIRNIYQFQPFAICRKLKSEMSSRLINRLKWECTKVLSENKPFEAYILILCSCVFPYQSPIRKHCKRSCAKRLCNWDTHTQGCISCLTCSYPELTEDHVLTSAYVKIFRNVTRNAVNKSV